MRMTSTMMVGTADDDADDALRSTVDVLGPPRSHHSSIDSSTNIPLYSCLSKVSGLRTGTYRYSYSTGTYTIYISRNPSYSS